MIDSPCLNICIYQEAKGLCTACGRTSNEIAQWPVATDGQKQQILASAKARLEEFTSQSQSNPAP